MTTGLLMSAPERAVYNALLKLQISFDFQSKMFGGRNVKGGLIADFKIPSLSLIIRVQGEWFHSRSDAKARDMLQKIALTTSGWTVIDILAEDVLRNPTFYVSEAIRGISHARQL